MPDQNIGIAMINSLLKEKYGMHQLIKVSTHILDTSCLCIDLMFKSKSNLIIESGVYLPLHLSCHRRIV